MGDQVPGVSMGSLRLVSNGIFVDTRRIQAATDFGDSDIAGSRLKRLIHGGVFPGFRHMFPMGDLFAIPPEVSTHLIAPVTIVSTCTAL